MSAPLPTEEDVLAHLVLYAARPVMTNCYATAQLNERDAWNEAVAPRPTDPISAVAVLALGRLRAHPSLEAAIADSERRLDCERAREDVLEEARRHARITRMLGTSRATATDQAVEDLERAETEVSRHGG